MKLCFPKVQRSPALHAGLLPCRRVTSLLSQSWNSRSSTEWKSTTLLVLGDLTPTVHRDPLLLTATAGEPLHPTKEWDLQLSEERKEVISTTTRTLQGVIYPAYPSLRNTAGAPREKSSKPQLWGHKGLKL
jgi:hypothetical protein